MHFDHFFTPLAHQTKFFLIVVADSLSRTAQSPNHLCVCFRLWRYSLYICFRLRCLALVLCSFSIRFLFCSGIISFNFSNSPFAMTLNQNREQRLERFTFIIISFPRSGNMVRTVFIPSPLLQLRWSRVISIFLCSPHKKKKTIKNDDSTQRSLNESLFSDFICVIFILSFIHVSFPHFYFRHQC